MVMVTSKEDVRDFWDKASCGEKLYLEGVDLEGFSKQSKIRYELTFFPFAYFRKCGGKESLRSVLPGRRA